MVDKYLRGDEFSTAYKFRFDSDWPLRDRFAVFEQLFADKNVIHVGCVDHLPVIQEKMKEGTWVHGRLLEVAKRCVGFDINSEGIALLQSEYSIDDVFAHDVCQGIHESIRGVHWDYIFVSEVLEHIDNPVAFLGAIRDIWRGHVDRLALTVPNAFRYENSRNATKGFELINSDHRYWFTPFTISKVVCRGGFHNPQVHFITASPRTRKLRPTAYLQWRKLASNPAFRDTLFVEAGF